MDNLETPIGKEEDSRLGDFIEADIENPEQDVAKNLLREDLEGVLATLSPRERDVLRLRYGLDDGRMKTLEVLPGGKGKAEACGPCINSCQRLRPSLPSPSPDRDGQQWRPPR